MTEHDPKLNILAPIETRPKLDRLERLVRRSGGGRMTRAEALGLGGLALLAAAGCGGKTSTGGGGGASSSGATDSLAGKPMESNLVIYNWSQYDDPSTYKSFKTENHVAVKETYYSSNDELLAKLQAGGTGYDIIVPSQNAVGELVQLGSLMKLDQALIPNASAVESSWVKTAYDPTGEYKVVKDFGVTGFFYNNKIITEKPTTMKQFYDLLPKYGKVGRTNLLDGAEEVVPLALMALGYDPNTGDPAVLDKAKSFLLDPRRRYHDRLVQLHQRRVGRQDHPRAGLERRYAADRRGPQEAGQRHHRRAAARYVREVGRQLVHPGHRARSGGGARVDQPPLRPGGGGQGDGVPQLPDPDPGGARPDAGGAEERPAVQRAHVLHRPLQVHPQPLGGDRQRPHADLHGVPVCLI
jgi:hypothetical protein